MILAGNSPGANFPKQIFTRCRRRILRRGGKSKERNTALRGGEIPGAFGAGSNVRAERLALFAGENAESEEFEVFFPNWMHRAQVNSRFRASMAVRIQVFTVPKGAPVRSAISLWDMPSK